MANDTPLGLLPQATIPFQGRSLRIDRLVGSGATSEVYQGVLPDEPDQPTVAVKAMKPLEFAGARAFFLGEALTLAQLPNRERETNNDRGLPDDFHVAPAYFGSDKYRDDGGGEVDFLVMAWIGGRQLPDLLAESPDGRLPEAQALTTGFHLYRTLDLLHTTLRKSYIDLKFENLWWDGPPDGGQLRMTDFGTLEDIQEGNDRGVRRDLLVAATYLCKLLTGYMPHHTAGELREAAVPLIQRADISWGARQLLSRLLHPNADERPRTAADVLTPDKSPAAGGPDLTGLIGLTDLVDYWRRSPQSLITVKDRAWERGRAAEGNERLKWLGRARAALDIWADRGSADDAARIAQEAAQLDELLQQSGLLDRGRALFNAGTYSQAESLFTQGRGQSYEPARIALFRRWAYLAQIGLDPKAVLSAEHRQDLIRVVDQLGRREWDAAARQLAELRPALGQAAAFQRLEADLALYHALDRAAQDTGDYDAAVSAYDDALAALDRLPQKERDDIVRDETGKLLPERDRLAALAAERAGRSAGAKLMAEAAAHLDAAHLDAAELDEDRATRAFVAARRALIVEPFDLDARRRELAGLIDRALSGGKYDLAAALAAAGLEGRGDAPQLRDRARLAGALRDAESAFDRGDTAGFVARVDTIARLPGGPKRLAALLGRTGEQAKEDNDAGLLRALAGLPLLTADRADLTDRADAIDRNWRDDSDRRAAAQRDRLRPVVDNLLSEAERCLYLADPAGGAGRPDFSGWGLETYLAYLNNRRAALQQAADHAQQAQTRAREIDHRVNEAEALLKRVQWARGKLQADDAAAQTAQTRDSQQAINTRQQLAEMAAALVAPIGSAGAPSDAAAQADNARNLLLGGRWYLTAVDPADAEVALWAEQAAARLDYLGPDGWAELQQAAGERLSAFQAAFARAEAAFEAGQTVDAENGQPLTAPLALYGGAPRYAAFVEKWGRGVEWQRVGDSFQSRPADRYQPDTLAVLRGWLPLALPPAFWERSPAAGWLAATTAAAAAAAARSMAVVRQPYAQPTGPHYDSHGQFAAARPAAAGPAAYLDTLKWWFDAAATERVADPGRRDAGAPATDRPAWSAPAFLSAAAAAALAGDAAALGHAITAGPPPDVGRALAELTPEAWRQAVEAQRRPEFVPPAPRPRWLPYALTGAALAVLLLLGGLGYVFRDRLGLAGLLDGTPTADAAALAANATATAAAALAALPPTLTPPPTAPPTPLVTPTLTPTLTLTPTATPTATATPPPPEASGFFVSDPAQLPLAAPVSGATLWLMPPDADSAQPRPEAGLWQTATDPILGDISYIEDFSSPVSLGWIHDQPLAEGLYQLYVIDTTVQSLGAQTFEVMLDDQPVEPTRGVRDVIFDCYEACGQREPTWLPIGAYTVASGQRLSVRAVADPARGGSFAAPWLLVARLGDRERALLEALPAPDQGRPLVVLLDDDRLQVYNSGEDGAFGFTDSRWPAQQEAADPPVWNGRHRPATLDPTQDYGLRAEWLPLGRLRAGEYQLYAYVPAGGNALVNYAVVVNGEPVEDIITSTEQRHFAGGWVDLGTWTVPEEAGVSVWATALKTEIVARYAGEASWVIGADAVALFRVGE